MNQTNNIEIYQIIRIKQLSLKQGQCDVIECFLLFFLKFQINPMCSMFRITGLNYSSTLKDAFH